MAAFRQQANKENGSLKGDTNVLQNYKLLPQKNVSFIADSNGKFEKLWQFSAYLKSMGCDIIAVSRIENMIDENTPQIEYNDKQFCIRTCAMGTSTFSTLKTGGTVYPSLKVGSIEYIPDKDDTF